jgi:polysaccharide biosynthesis protein PslG
VLKAFLRYHIHTFLVLAITTSIMITVPLQAQVPAEYFGLQATNGIALQPPQWWSNPWPEVPIGSMRLWDTGTGWAEINTADGVYDWTLFDEWLDDAQKFNVPEVMYTFGRTPQWASSNPNDQTCSPAWGPGTCDPPKDLNPDGTGPDQLWQTYVATLAQHSAGRIKYWELWNEPKNAYYWNGTVAQLVRMAKDARSVILSIDPQAVLLTPPTHGPYQASYFAAGGAQYADVITYHGYTYTSGCAGFPRSEDELQRIAGVRSIMSAYGQAAKPLWDTEVSWGVTSASCFYHSNLQAAYLAQMYMLHWSAGVKRVFWYQYNNQLNGTLWLANPDPKHRDAPGTLLKPGVAYEQVYQWMVGATMDGPCAVSGTTWTCNFKRPGGYVAQAVWDTSQSCNKGICTTVDYAVDPQYTNYRSLYGGKIKINGGKVPAGAKPILLEN